MHLFNYLGRDKREGWEERVASQQKCLISFVKKSLDLDYERTKTVGDVISSTEEWNQRRPKQTRC